MATAAAGKKLEWLIIVPDHEGVIEKRLEVRAYVCIPLNWIAANLGSRKHLEGVKPLHSENKIIMGGAMFSHPPKDGEEPLPMVGSALLAYAESKEEVMKILENDIYNKNGVWDLSKVQIWPFKSAVRSDISTTSDLHPVQSVRQGA